MRDDLIFIDTNILVYANDVSDERKRERARQIIHDVIVEGNGCISTQVLAEFWVTVTRKLAIPLSAELAREQIQLLSSLKIIPVDHAMVLEALQIQERWQFSYWDAQILAAANRASCAFVYTEDLHDGALIGSVTIKNPFDYDIA